MLLPAIALLTFTFEGGSVSEFAEELSRSSNMPVCVALESDKVPAVRIEYESRTELARRLARELQLDLDDAKWFGYGPRSYSDAMFMPAFRTDYWTRFPSGGMTIHKKGTQVELRPEKDFSYLAVADLPSLRWSKKVSVHSFLQTYRFVMAGSGTEETTLRAIAAAIGGKLSNRRMGFEIDLDCAVVRRRWTERFRRSLAADGSYYDAANAQFAIEALTQAPDSVIRAALAKQNAKAHYEIPRSGALRAAAEAKVEASRRLARGEGGLSGGADYLSLIDFEKPWCAELTAGGAVSLRMTSKDGRGVIHF